jgi:hypothetical protein
MEIITDKVIKNDIAEFEQRIQAAREKLDALPATAIERKEHKKIKAKRRELKSEITHVKKLIGYAKEALENETKN